MKKPTIQEISLKQAKSAVKITTVMLRDHSPMRLHEVMRDLIYCWERTESMQESLDRESGA